LKVVLYAPEPTQDIDRKYGDARPGGNAGQDGIEEVEGAHGAHTNEVEERPFHSQVSEWLVQALKDSVRTTLLLWFVWHSFLDLGAREGGW